MFGFMGGYLPQAPAQMAQGPMIYQPAAVQPQPQPQQKPIGRWTTARSFADVQAAAVPADGAQTIFMLENEPIFYLVGMQDGRKMVQGYRFDVLLGDNKPEPEPVKQAAAEKANDNTEARLAKLEQFAARMQELLGDEAKEEGAK